MLVTRQQLGVIDANISTVSQVEKSVADQFKNGLAKRIDLDRVRVNLTNLRTQRDQLLNNVTQQENALKYFIGMPINTNIIIPNAELREVELNAAAKIADSVNLEGRTEVKLLKKQQESLMFQKKSFRGGYIGLRAYEDYSIIAWSNELTSFNRSSDAFWYVWYASVYHCAFQFLMVELRKLISK